MDKLISFRAKSHVGHLKQKIQQEQKLQFYSEEDGESSGSQDVSPQNEQKTQQQQKSNGFQTDESEGGTPKNTKIINHQTAKMSRFSNLMNSKKIDGDVENEPNFSDHEQDAQIANQDIEAQAQQIQQKLSQQKVSEIAKIKQTHSLHNLKPNNSDIDNKNKQIKSNPFRHLIFGEYFDQQLFKKHLMLIQRGLLYAKKCLKGPSDQFIESKKVILNEANPKKDRALILDLDETLIHSCTLRENPQVILNAIGDFGESAQIGINIRPFTQLFLTQMSQLYTIYIYTASSLTYATTIIKYLDPKKKYISDILTRNNCMETKNGFFIKDLRLISNKKLKDMLIVDNLAHSFGFQIENGIPILEWHNDQNDQELKYLIDYLKEAIKYDDLREYNKRLRLDELMESLLEE